MSIDLRLYFDACCFIDLVTHTLRFPTIAARADHIYFCRKFIDAARNKEALIITSTLTVTECTHVRDESKAEKEKIIKTEQVKRLFQGMLLSGKSGITPAQPTPQIIELARDLVWVHGTNLQPMDSLHVATALFHNCTHFITTDGLRNDENKKILNDLGLAVCQADEISHLLPSHHAQMQLTDEPRN